MRRTDPQNGAAAARPALASIAGRVNNTAPLLFVLLWSSSFLGTRIGLRHMSPLWFVALRMILAAAIVSGTMTVLRRPWNLSRMAWLHCAVVGVSTQAVLLMTAHVAMTRIEAAPIALIQTLNPLLCALLAWPLLGEQLRPSQIVGLLLGFAGVLLILGLAALNSRAELPDLFGAIAGVGTLSGGTLYFRRFCRDVPALPGAAAQFLASAIVCTGSAMLLEPFWTDWNPGAFAGIAWNTVAVSMGGMALYFLMLTRGTAARATVNFYLVPGVTSVLTWAILGERLTPVMLLGLAISSVGCWLVGRRRN
ncbi:MAG: DMT family transporter [Acetobacteraceae bacterium]|jgi:drug/metabolite transporter (DMT)-like permease